MKKSDNDDNNDNDKKFKTCFPPPGRIQQEQEETRVGDEDDDCHPNNFNSIIREGREHLDSFLKNKHNSFEDIADTNQEEVEVATEQQQADEKLNLCIDNELSLIEFIKLINEKDKGKKPNEESKFNFHQIADILITKTLDTFEDAVLMLERKIEESSSYNEDFVSPGALDEWNNKDLLHKPRLLVIGSGWSSHAFIKVVDTRKYRVLNVSPTNYFVFTPMLASSSVGTTEIRSIVESVRDSNPTVRFLEGTGLNVDVEKQQVQVKLGEGQVFESYDDNDDKEDTNSTDNINDKNMNIINLDYDILVYAAGVGPLSSSNRISGLCIKNVHFLKSVRDAKRLRSSAIDLFEKASQPNITDEERRRLLTFVIVGAGPTGVEYTGELSDFVSDITGYKAGKDKDLLSSNNGSGFQGHSRTSTRTGIKRTVAPFANLFQYTRIVLVQGGQEILPQFDQELRVSAKAALERVGVEVFTNTRVLSIESKERLVVSIQEKEDETRRVEEIINCGMIVWAGGTKPVKLTEQLINNVDQCYEHRCNEPRTKTTNQSCKKDEKEEKKNRISSLSVKGRIPVDKWLRVVGTPSGNVLAMGDAAVTVGDGTTILPQTAQVAAQQGAYVARLLNRGFDLTGGEGEKSSKKCNDDSYLLYLNPPTKNNTITDGTGTGTMNGTTPNNTIMTKLRSITAALSLSLSSPPRPTTIEAKPFQFLNLGQLAYIGGGEALSQVQIGDNHIYNQAGSTGFLLWRSVYVVKQVSTKTRLLVLFDWFKTRIFGRDVTRM
jgi:NADH dehydrogenase FAD-containing subunit